MVRIVMCIILFSAVPMFAVANTTNVPPPNIVQLYKTTEVVEKVNQHYDTALEKIHQFYNDAMGRIIDTIAIFLIITVAILAIVQVLNIITSRYELREMRKLVRTLKGETQSLSGEINSLKLEFLESEKRFQSDYTKLSDLHYSLTRQTFYQIEMNIFSTLSQLNFEKEAATPQNMDNILEKYADVLITQMKSGVDFLKEIIDYADIYKNSESEWLAYDMTCILFGVFWEPLSHIRTVPEYVVAKRKNDIIYIYKITKFIETYINTLGKSDIGRHGFEEFYKYLKIFMDNSGIKI